MIHGLRIKKRAKRWPQPPSMASFQQAVQKVVHRRKLLLPFGWVADGMTSQFQTGIQWKRRDKLSHAQ